MDNNKIDPIRAKYYAPIENLEIATEWLFWVAGALSLAAVAIDPNTWPTLFLCVQVSFVVSVVALFLMGLWQRLTLSPMAEHQRRLDFLSKAFEVGLAPEPTTNYYTAQETHPHRRMAAQLLENAIYSKNTAAYMLFRAHFTAGGYIACWLAIVLWRRTDIGLIVASAQVLFSEQVISRWFRLVWIHSRFQRVFEDTSAFLQANHPAAMRNASIISLFAYYECAKATATILLSQRAFDSTKHESKKEWLSVCEQLSVTVVEEG